MSKKNTRGRGLKLEEDFLNKVDDLCDRSYLSFPKIIEALLSEAMKYEEREGALSMPFKLVTARDFEEFQEYKARRDELIKEGLLNENPRVARAKNLKGNSSRRASGDS